MNPKKIILILFLFPTLLIAQVGIGTTDLDSMIVVRPLNQVNPLNTDGLLIPAYPPVSSQHGRLVFATGLRTPAQGFLVLG